MRQRPRPARAVVERRDHIGGNAYSEAEPQTGIEIHRYGAHLFHTSNARVWEYANRFTAFTGYQHRVFSIYKGRVYPLPINLATICEYFGRRCRRTRRGRWSPGRRPRCRPARPPTWSRRPISLIGRPLYEAFIRGYTFKQWQTDPVDLPAEIITRLPVRYTFNNRYFSDTFEGLPVDGYTAWLERMADHPNIEVRLDTDFADAAGRTLLGSVPGRVHRPARCLLRLRRG